MKFLKALFNLPEFKAPEGMLHPNLMSALKTTPTPEAVFALLDEGQLRRLKSISIDHLGGMSIDFYEEEEKETGGYYHYPSPMGEMPTEPSGAFNRTLLEGMTVSQFTDLMTLAALHEDESFEFGFGDCAIWVEADPAEIKEYLTEGHYQDGLEIWRQTLTREEQQDLKVALQNILFVRPKGSIQETVDVMSQSKDCSEDLKKHIERRWLLNQHIAVSFLAAQDEIEQLQCDLLKQK